MKPDNLERDPDMAEEYDFSQARRGPIVPPVPGRTLVTIPLEDELLEWCRAQVHAAGGGDYADLINEALRAYRMYAEWIGQRLPKAHRAT